MSLINQMLKDLESRRNPELPAGGVLPGNRPSITNSGIRPLTLSLAVLVALLALGLAYLLWQQQTMPKAVTVATAAVTPNATPASQAQPATAAKAIAAAPRLARVITQRQPPLVEKAQQVKAPTPRSRLTSITPSVVDGSDAPRTLTLKGEALSSALQIVVSWPSNEKVLPADRVEWLDATTARITLTTGNSDAQWQVALLRPDGSRSETVDFEVIAFSYAGSISTASVTNGHMEKVIHPPSNTEVADQLYQQGYQALQQRNSAMAEQLWQKALNTEPNHLKSREGLIALYLSQGRKVESAKLLEDGVRRHPEHAQFALLHARLLADEGHAAAAITTLEQAMGNTDPQQPELFALAAALYQQQHDYDKSISAYQRALYLHPQQSHWWMGLGISLEGAGKPKEAKTAYEEALQRGALTKESRQYVQQRLQELK